MVQGRARLYVMVLSCHSAYAVTQLPSYNHFSDIFKVG